MVGRQLATKEKQHGCGQEWRAAVEAVVIFNFIALDEIADGDNDGKRS